MLKYSKLYELLLILQIVTSIAVSLTLSSCGDDKRPSTAIHTDNKRPPQGGASKPTPEGGFNATSFAALNFISLVQVEKILDIALKGQNSAYISCQKVTSNQGSNASTKILAVDYSPCASRYKWDGREDIVITYDKTKKITKIEKKNNPGQSLFYNNLDNARLQEIMIDEDVTISLDDENSNSYTYSYNGGLEISYCRSGCKETSATKQEQGDDTEPASKASRPRRGRSAQDEQDRANDDRRRSRKIKNVLTTQLVAEGKLTIDDNSPTTWTLTRLESPSVVARQISSGSTRNLINFSFQMAATENASRVLACGRPVGLYNSTQLDRATNKTYTPVLSVDARGTISVQGTRGGESATSCDNRFDLLRAWSNLIVQNIIMM